jgi:ribonuclease HII
MKEAIGRLTVKPDVLLVDAVRIPDIGIKEVSIIKGDSLSISIAAASIVAKVTRDRMMDEYASIYPEYGFDSNKGYGSAKHIEAIKTIGPCDIHRRSFIKNFV